MTSRFVDYFAIVGADTNALEMVPMDFDSIGAVPSHSLHHSIRLNAAPGTSSLGRPDTSRVESSVISDHTTNATPNSQSFSTADDSSSITSSVPAASLATPSKPTSDTLQVPHAHHHQTNHSHHHHHSHHSASSIQLAATCTDVQLDTHDDETTPLSPPNLTPLSLQNLQFKATVLDQYPKADYNDFPLTRQLPMFCLPENVQITTECEMPRFFTFVLTKADGSRVYCSALWFFEYLTNRSSLDEQCDQLFHDQPWSSEMPSVNTPAPSGMHKHSSSDNLELDQLKDPPHGSAKSAFLKSQLRQTLYISKAIVLVSHYPLFSTFKKFLTQLYRIHLTPSSIPIERWICNFCSEVPLPPRGRTCVQYNLSPEKVFISRPPPNQLPLLDVPLQLMFLTLDLKSIVTIFNFILTEQQIIFHSNHYSLLGTAAEFFISIIYPFEWFHTYVPLLPKSCLSFLESPMPYIMGIHSSYRNCESIPDDAILVDLDHNRISTKNPKLMIQKLPERQHRKLIDMLQKLRIKDTIHCYSLENIDFAFDMAPTPDQTDSHNGADMEFPASKIRMAFFRFFVSLFQKYRHFMVKVNLDNTDGNQFELNYSPFFKKDQFVRDQPLTDRPFVRRLLETQAFDQFVKQRTLNNNSAEVVFFDESIQAKLNRSKLKFHKKDTPFLNNQALNINTTSVALTPLCSDLPEEQRFHHETFPQLDPNLLYTPRDIEMLVKPDDISSKNSIVSLWKPIIKQLNILQQQLGKQQRSKIRTDFNEAIQNSKNTLRRDHTRSISFGNMDFAQFESNISEASESEKTQKQTIQFGGAPVLLTGMSLPGDQGMEEMTRELFSCVCLEVTEKCPHCGHKLDNCSIRMGWSNDVQDYRTMCPQCNTKFVPRFTVVLDGKPIQLDSTLKMQYEYLSPALLRKEVENLIKNGVRTDANLLRLHSRIFWNLIVHFRDLSIPLNFLLPFLDWHDVAKEVELILKKVKQDGKKQ
uniref:UDENN domain-containing protein n=1 Tax=Percolomonas cosmopolitus TaxID=63605 RepID=A0A7S1KMY1_9EUKA|mmetsp:Transcript_2254/g.8300  ORF Transcript_2254/g.8300 Transcript_2254/m.8300 type:complete len:980 (+) Transcript_2254:547-3486(+)|eukprot:CAMPEP_0117441738 /NCGR_PEP_ID=MMETSP0759-20121206/3787_1 /TAXON_ID=63605 /ORGANISM="Percolomonas cosmopolitus, Strain WS" /LENGTH=979 /DNA_ID=CAMNT_0005233597 /DNA_START=346 /DNA_END=3285 /DNA_ORIENTATION=-